MTGRFTKVRGWLGDQVSTPPMLIDRRHGAGVKLYPCLQGGARYEWDAIKDRAVRQIERQRREVYEGVFDRPRAKLAPLRIAGIFGRNEYLIRHLLWSGLAMTSFALDSAYSIGGSPADAIGTRLQLLDGKTLDTVYFYIVSYNGTAANVNDINLELRPEASAGASTPHTSTLTESKSVNPSSATGWIASTGWTSVLAALSRYFLIVADADGNGTDYATVGLATTYHDGVTPWSTPLGFHVQTTGGFNTGNTNSSGRASMLVVKFSDGTVRGISLATTAGAASSTNQRGLKIDSDAFTNPTDVFGMIWNVSNANCSGLKIYTGTNGPASGAAHTSTDIIYGAAARTGAFMSGGAAYRFSPGTAYRLVATFSGATTGGPQKLSIGTGADATLRLAMPGGGKFSWTLENAGAWSDDADATAGLMLLLDAEVAPVGGSGNAQSVMGGRLVR